MERAKHRIEKNYGQSLRNWGKIETPSTKKMTSNSFSEMGWGRLLFAHTFDSNDQIVEAMCSDGYAKKDIAIYVIDPHVIISMAPDKLFLDPSHTYRLWNYDYRYENQKPNNAFSINRLSRQEEAQQVNAIYAKCHMKRADPDFLLEKHANKLRTYFIAKRRNDDQVIGIVTGIDHAAAFHDPENGSSLWSLAVDPQAGIPGVGMSLVRHMAAHYFTKGRTFMDVSVMHNNAYAINLYKKLVQKAGIKTPRQIIHSDYKTDIDFMNALGRAVVKPARGEQGAGISLDISTPEELSNVLKKAAVTVSQTFPHQPARDPINIKT